MIPLLLFLHITCAIKLNFSQKKWWISQKFGKVEETIA